MKMFGSCIKSLAADESPGGSTEGELVYRRRIGERLREGYTYLINGKISSNGDRFIVDFCVDNRDKDVALRLVFDISAKTLARRSRKKRKWSSNETDIACPLTFHMDVRFEIQVFFNRNDIFIAFDGMHLAKYEHRMPFTDINIVEIRGSIREIITNHKYITNYPIRENITAHVCRLSGQYSETADPRHLETNMAASLLHARERQFLPLPFYATFDRGFIKLSYSIIIKGYVSASPNNIKISLQMSQNVWPESAKAMLMEFRFPKTSDGGAGQPVLAFNTYTGDAWTGEVIAPLEVALRPGSYMYLVIERCSSSFEINVNKTHVYNYKHILKPEDVNTCLVDGSIKIIDVLIESA